MSTTIAGGDPQPKPKLGDFLYASEMSDMLGLSKWVIGNLGRKGVIATRRVQPRGRLLYSISDAKRIIAGDKPAA